MIGIELLKYFEAEEIKEKTLDLSLTIIKMYLQGSNKEDIQKELNVGKEVVDK